jgi:hypothetical protein
MLASPSGIALPKLQHRFDLRVALITAVALLIAQFGAMTHAYSHDSPVKPGSTHQSNPGSHAFCSDCLNFAPLLSAAGTPIPLPTIQLQGRGFGVPAECRSLVDLPPHLAFRSRAPPATPSF